MGSERARAAVAAGPARRVAGLLVAAALSGCAVAERYVASPSFAPDGKSLVLNLCEIGAGCKVATFELASGRLREFQPPLRASWFAPVFSADGSRLAFSVAAEGSPRSRLAVLNADGTGRRSRPMAGGSSSRRRPPSTPATIGGATTKPTATTPST